MKKRLPSVVLVGRPNVGKSTLFNRLSGTRRAIVTTVAGTTRDVIAQRAEWRGREFELVDTGGMFGASQDPLHELVLDRGRRAIASADLLVLVVDGREGLVPGDREIAQVIREADTPAILVINKADDRRTKAGSIEFYEMGFDDVFEISAEHGMGTGDLLDAIIDTLQSSDRPAPAVTSTDSAATTPDTTVTVQPGELSIAIVGRPNAGKSSLVNRFLKEERMIVSEMPGTTRDTVDSMLTWHKRQFRIVDTAGIRRPGRVASAGQVEGLSVMLARRAIAAADIVVLVIDASAGITEQDAAIAGEAHEAGRGIIIAANKWDLMKDRGSDFVTAFDEDLRRRLKFLDYAPVLHVSAATGERTPKLLEAIDRVATARATRVKTHALNAFVKKVTAANPPASPGRGQVRILYAAQTAVAPPTFVLFTNIATSFHFSYERFLLNQLRKEFGFEGTPLRIQVRRRQREARPAGAGRRPSREA
jgi:GTP-binding protein